MLDVARLIFSNEIYTLLLVVIVIYAGLKGGAPERWVGLIFLTGSVASVALLSPLMQRYVVVELGVFAIDFAMLGAIMLIMFRANRYWTIWICSMQVIQVLSHLPMFFMPDLLPLAYGAVIAIWAYPMLGILAAATYRHQKRLKTFGADRPWSNYSAA